MNASVATEATSISELDPLRWKALAVVCAAFFMTVLDVSIVNVALPTIGTALHFSRDNLQWVVTAYAITFGGFLLLGGRAADLLGRRRVFLVGVVVFTVASFLCGLAWSEGVLIGARAVQGFGAAIITPAALSIISTTFPEGAERNKALGIWGAMGGSGAAVGVLAGGLLTTYLGWEWIFYVNVPVGIIAFVLAPRYVRESRGETTNSFDLPGAITVTAGIALLVYAVANAPNHGWESSWTIIRLALAAVLLVAFLVIESRSKDPLMPFSIFRIRTVTGANVCSALLGAVTFSNFFILTLYVQQVLHYSALKTGADVRRHRRERRPVRRARAVARDEDRREARSGRRLRRVRARNALVHPDPDERLLLRRSLPGLPARRLRAPVHLHPGVDRRSRRRRASRGRACLGAPEHHPAGRRRDRRRRGLVDHDQPLQPPDGVRHTVPAGVHERLAVGVLDDVRCARSPRSSRRWR